MSARPLRNLWYVSIQYYRRLDDCLARFHILLAKQTSPEVVRTATSTQENIPNLPRQPGFSKKTTLPQPEITVTCWASGSTGRPSRSSKGQQHQLVSHLCAPANTTTNQNRQPHSSVGKSGIILIQSLVAPRCESHD
jgi:hypothetical protein